ncbi:sensor histidine kinase [Paractinoplanes hotanensis]|uniref:Sensor-like histidine kinase SenX3 n=1 Tax=Paractinoplanes hotanensis TaxID=2906497 RepID=A0ABT0Y506_9ACTN|nr:HAMP domain-containing sensor histidine kinase [Actinoplanes hotanensis]MCM4081119.1 HAMP domain-containing histidine kinase [Actinoplanes hotanensis]
MNASARLRTLPRWITLWSLLAGAAGIVVLGTLLVRSDAARRDAEIDAELRRVTSTVSRLVRYDGTVTTAAVLRDPLEESCPQFAVLPGAAVRFGGHFSRHECVPVDPVVLTSAAERATASGRLTWVSAVAEDGRPIRLVAEPFRQPDQQAIGAVVAVADAAPAAAAHRQTILVLVAGGALLLVVIGVAGRLLAARALRPVAAALEQQEVLLADTAHDLRTPVAALRALAEAALLNPGHRAELLPRTVELAQRMGTIIDGVLIRARLAAGVQTLEREPVWLDQLVSTVVDETPAEGAQVTVTTAPSRVVADAALVRRAIGNLLDNALRHGRVPGQAAIVHITVAGGRVMVADHGPGIDPELADAAFDRFHSTGGSSGLGLSIVRWVAEAHGGVLRVYNAEEGGAIFELALPADAG